MGEWVRNACNMCAQCCGLEMLIENNEIVSVRPDPDNPRSKGYCCRKARAAAFYQHHADRLDYPLKRVGEEYVRIPWDQALGEIAEKMNAILKEHGPRALAVVGCTLSSAQGELYLAQALMSLVGTQYYYNPIGLEFMGVFWSHGKVLGRQIMTRPDEERSDVLVIWGCNAYVSHQMRRARTELREISEDPDRMLITVDPRLSETARMSDLHIMLRPGSDALLLRAMIALIFREGWQHQEYLDQRVSDYRQVAHWFDDVDIEEACRVCGVPYESIREFCRILTTQKWSLHQDLGIYMGRHNTLSTYLLLILMCVCGTFLVPGGTLVGGGFMPLGPHTNEDDPNVWKTVATNRAPVLGSYPTGVLPAEILSDHPEHLRAVITSKSNPARSFADTEAQEKALSSLELLVCIDCAMTETAKHAHYILPGKTAYEAYDFCVFQNTYPELYIQLKQPVVQSQGERREDAEIWMNIADAMGIIPPIPASLFEAAHRKSRMEYFQELMAYLEENPSYKPALLLIIGKTMGAAMGSVTKSIFWGFMMTSRLLPMLAPTVGYTPGPAMLDEIFDEVIAHREGILIGMADINNTFGAISYPDGKMRFFTQAIDDYIKDITPEQEALALMPTDEFPLVMSAGTHADGGVNGVMRNPDSYRYRRPWKVLIHPEDAREYGIADGQLVTVSTQAGSVEVEAEYTYRAGKGFLQFPHHYGFDFNGKTVGAPVNRLTRAEDMDQITGNPVWRYVPCRVDACAAKEA